MNEIIENLKREIARLEELAAEVNEKIADEWAEFEATVKKNQVKYK